MIRLFLIVAAIINLIFGVGFELMPGIQMQTFGVVLGPGGQLVARVLGGTMLGIAITLWWSRDLTMRRVFKGVLLGGLVANVVGLVVVFIGVLSGQMSAMGWVPVILHLFLTAGFGYFAFASGEPSGAASPV